MSAAPVVGTMAGLAAGYAGGAWASGWVIAAVAVGWPCISCILTPVSSLEVSGSALLTFGLIGVGLAAGALVRSGTAGSWWPRTCVLLGLLLNGWTATTGAADLREAERERAAALTFARMDALKNALCKVAVLDLPTNLEDARLLLPPYDRNPGAELDGWGKPFV